MLHLSLPDMYKAVDLYRVYDFDGYHDKAQSLQYAAR